MILQKLLPIFAIELWLGHSFQFHEIKLFNLSLALEEKTNLASFTSKVSSEVCFSC